MVDIGGISPIPCSSQPFVPQEHEELSKTLIKNIQSFKESIQKTLDNPSATTQTDHLETVAKAAVAIHELSQICKGL